MKRHVLAFALALCAFIAAGCGEESDGTEFSPAVEKIELPGTKSVCQSSTVLLASQPGVEGLRAAKERHDVAYVLNLRQPDELDFDEGAEVANLGMTYLNIPFGNVAALTDAIFESIRAVLRDPAMRPLMVHCSSANRVGAVWYAYRCLDQGISRERALYEARLIGLTKEPLVRRAEEYVAAQGAK